MRVICIVLALLGTRAWLAQAQSLPFTTPPGAEPRDSIKAAVYNGRAGQTAVRIPRFDHEIPIDGSLDSAEWRSAAELTGFSQYTPVDGQPAADSTEALVWYSPSALYVGIRAFEAHGAVHATLASRDNIDADDNVEIILSTYHDGRQAFVFAVNPLGVQEDGTMTEGRPPDPNAPFTIATTGRPPLDLTPDFVYESKGRLTATGYQVTVRIPFKSLRYQSAGVQDWGINFIRKVQHSGVEDTWTAASRSSSSFLAQSGTLTGLRDLHRGLVLDMAPIVTEHVDGAAAGASGWHYGVERPQFGGNIRYGITQNLTLNGTIRPDFAEVESDVVEFVTDPRVSLFYPEKRPFFLDGIEQFVTPVNPLIYTRRIVAPIAGAKLTGKIDDFNVAFLSAEDEKSAGVTGTSSPIYDLLRVQRDIGSEAKVGLVATDVEERGAYNRVVGADALVPFDSVYLLTLEAVGSGTRDGAVTGAGPYWHADLNRAGHVWESNLHVDAVDPEFQTRAGYIPQTNITNIGWINSISFYPKPGGLFQTIKLLSYNGRDWSYRALTAGHGPLNIHQGFDTYYALRGGWTADLSLYLDQYGYDHTIYPAYYLPHAVGHDTTFVPFTGGGRIPNTEYRFVISTPQFAHLSGSADYTWGRAEEFFEWAAADIEALTITGTWRPTTTIRADLLYNLLSYRRHADDSQVGLDRVPRLDVSYQLSRAISFRVILQYDASFQANLRDASRTNLPIFLRDSLGVLEPATGFTSNGIATQSLFAYQPVPGTVFFFGYNSALTEPVPFDFHPIHRTGDGLFVKFSYLFRV
jgi:hypothetical protein